MINKYTLILSLVLPLISAYPKVYYLYQHTSQLQLNETDGLPPIVTINCAVQTCKQIRTDVYPSMFIWGGPGTSYRSITPPTSQGIKEYLQRRNNHPLQPLRRFIQQTSFPIIYLLSTIVCILLYFMFYKLFTLKSLRYYPPYEPLPKQQ